jgi:hypothetical protein
MAAILGADGGRERQQRGERGRTFPGCVDSPSMMAGERSEVEIGQRGRGRVCWRDSVREEWATAEPCTKKMWTSTLTS